MLITVLLLVLCLNQCGINNFAQKYSCVNQTCLEKVIGFDLAAEAMLNSYQVCTHACIYLHTTDQKYDGTVLWYRKD